MYQNQPVFNPFAKFLRSRSAMLYLIGTNVAVWLFLFMLQLVAFLFNTENATVSAMGYAPWVDAVVNWLAVPANLGVLALKPYTLFTYMFLHVEFMHILFNMLWFYWFGKIFLEFLSDRQMVTTYIMGGLGGAFIFILAYNLFPVFAQTLPISVALGASASVMAIVVCISAYVPDYTIPLIFMGPVKIKYIAIVFVVIDIAMIRSGNAGGHFAHIGGAMWGFSYAMMLRKGIDPAKLYSLPWLWKLTKGSWARKSPLKKVHVTSRPLNDETYNQQRALKQKQIDIILEKISRSGYSSLSKEEREFLFKTSNKS
jgi:membrane associated rhomboid family serine protease